LLSACALTVWLAIPAPDPTGGSGQVAKYVFLVDWEVLRCTQSSICYVQPGHILLPVLVIRQVRLANPAPQVRLS
jgi:hypothetical protein